MYWIRKYFSEPAAHFQAIYEVIVTAIFSLLPFVVSIMVASARKTDGSFVDLVPMLGRGQLYLISYSVFGTVFWLAFLKSDSPRHSARAFIGLAATISIFPVVGFLGVDATFSTILNPTIINAGYYFYGFLLLANYLLLFYMNVKPPEPLEVLGREAGAMRERYEELRND